MTNSHFINLFVNNLEIKKNTYSCLSIAIRDARMITGRNLETGEMEFNILNTEKTFLNPYSFIGIINYLLILDMIGSIFSLKNFKTEKESNIYKALKQFSKNINEKDIFTIIALRNSLAHNYSLANIPKSKKENDTKLHHFVIKNSIDEVTIKHNNKWDGKYNSKQDLNSTEIGAENIIALIEEVISNLKIEVEKDNVEINFSLDELKMRFTIIE
jgi:hypothetical protein